jgi:hypothetical protein
MSTTAIPIMYIPSISISIWNASKPLLNYYDKLQVTTHRLFPKFCTSKSESHHQMCEFKIIIIMIILHSAGNNKSDSSKQQFQNNMDCNRPYNKTKYATCREYFVLSTHTALFLPQIIFNASNTSVNFFSPPINKKKLDSINMVRDYLNVIPSANHLWPTDQVQTFTVTGAFGEQNILCVFKFYTMHNQIRLLLHSTNHLLQRKK